MTLVGVKEGNGNILSIMLSVQQQHHHHPLHGSATTTGQAHRGNVIVSTNGMPGNDIKNLQQHGCKRSSKLYGQATGPYGTVSHQPASVARRNARERNRVKQVNNGFATLRQHIPQSVAQALGGSTAGTHGGSRVGSKKLSKVETLRMAVEYIRSLQRLLDEHDGCSDVVTSGASLLSSSSLASSCSSSSSSSSSTTSSTSSTTSPAARSPGKRLGSDSSHHPAELRLHGTVNNDIRHHGVSRSNDIHRHQHIRQNPSPTFVPTPCSEASSSPTPSFVSEASSAGSQGYGTSTGTLYAAHSDGYDNYEPMSPEDEELLDVISWWQQSQ